MSEKDVNYVRLFLNYVTLPGLNGNTFAFVYSLIHNTKTKIK
jgi:hypothetical protein